MRRPFVQYLAHKIPQIRLRGRPNGLVLLAFLLLILVAIGVSLPKPSTLLTLQAHTETLEFEVLNDDSAIISVPFAFAESNDQCIAGVEIHPFAGSRVSYTRITNGPLYIGVQGQVTWQDEEGIVGQAEELRFVVNEPLSGCGFTNFLRLPANGIASVGIESTFSTDTLTPMLLRGDLVVYNRSLHRVLGVIPLNWGPFVQDALYPAEEFKIPAGSRLLNAMSDTGLQARWWGFVDVDFLEYSSNSLSLNISANARSIELFAPAPAELNIATHGPAPATSKPDVISLSFGARIASDPNLQWIYGILALLTLIATLFQVFSTKPKTKERRDERRRMPSQLSKIWRRIR